MEGLTEQTKQVGFSVKTSGQGLDAERLAVWRCRPFALLTIASLSGLLIRLKKSSDQAPIVPGVGPHPGGLARHRSRNLRREFSPSRA